MSGCGFAGLFWGQKDCACVRNLGGLELNVITQYLSHQRTTDARIPATEAVTFSEFRPMRFQGLGGYSGFGDFGSVSYRTNNPQWFGGGGPGGLFSPTIARRNHHNAT
ncbi:hypothetical protein SPBR_02126 [Sporothrix brasiliensis 5110]|uniref:Uncharacterized protein n=1 Tax=Sporothrix brasiliensis 5110 TaxID=1398154 RepID=A0A0C2EXP1_9PEZI|nr:uncharacterized protein SPBR_02126 [Sporothrix brasiliensis 5110]KIH91424.1 hypothetical protein SPBR_02126 [Sporothrix brasiliensis 5110]